MPLLLGLDVGTTTITALAVDAVSGEIQARQTVPNDAETTSQQDRTRGRSEWDARQIADRATACLRQIADRLNAARGTLVGLGLTGQQHGVVVVDESLEPLTPFLNWQDRRGTERIPGSDQSYVEQALDRTSDEARSRTGCRLATGYLGTTLFWMREKGVLPSHGTACFIMDYVGAMLTGETPVTEPTSAASSGLFDVRENRWDEAMLEALGLSHKLFPEIRAAGHCIGRLTREVSDATGLPEGLPVCVALGDNQASFFGSVARRDETVLVNVGTGGQVAAFSDRFVGGPGIETRPFPLGGFLLVNAGLCGGRSYAVLERFFRDVGRSLLGVEQEGSLYPSLNVLAASAPPGCDGLRCEPLFTGTRENTELRACWSGASPENFTAAHVTRALLEGMAEVFHRGYRLIESKAERSLPRLVGSGNGLRENLVLAKIVADRFGMPLVVPRHREEAAFGAALVAAIGLDVLPDIEAAGKLIRYSSETDDVGSGSANLPG